MKMHLTLTASAAALATPLFIAATPVLALDAQVIFTSGSLTAIDANGVARKVGKGDVVLSGERLVTPPGIIGQIRLPDGTLVGTRPGADITFDTVSQGLGKNVLTLNEGNVRVINTEPPAGSKPVPIDIVSPLSTLVLSNGDGEAIHVKAGGKPDVEPGTYSRLQLGEATVRNAKGSLPLTPMQSGFSSRLGTPPATVATLPPSISRVGTLAPTLLPPTTSVATTDLRAVTTLTPTLTTSVLTVPTLTSLSPLPTLATIQPVAIAPISTTLSPTVTPTATLTIQPVLTTVILSPVIAVALRPPPPPPPPPPPRYIFRI